MKLSILFLILVINIIGYSQTGYEYSDKYNLWYFSSSELKSENTQHNDLFVWQFVQTQFTFHFTDVFFIDTLKGWATHTSNGSIRTTNGGFNWDSSSYNDTNFTTLYNGVWFVNQNTGWCVGGALQIRKTTNGGLNWFKQTPPPAAGVFNQIYFWNENSGIAIGRKNISFNSFIAKTTNSGQNWFEIIATSSSNNELWDMYWFNENTGWICGRDVLLKSTNGGLNYVNLYGNIPPTQNGANALLCICFVNEQIGWIGGSNLDKKNIYITTNAGTNWIFQPNPVSNYAYVQINDIKMLNADSGWAVHGTPASGAIMFTTNSGVNWIIEEGSNYWFDCLTYYQRQKAWCGSSSGKVWFTYLNQPVGIITSSLPMTSRLYPCYPNPFNPVTKIKFDISAGLKHQNSKVKINVYNILGEEVSLIINEEMSPGSYEVLFDGTNFSSGVYFIRMAIESSIYIQKLVLLK